MKKTSLKKLRERELGTSKKFLIPTIVGVFILLSLVIGTLLNNSGKLRSTNSKARERKPLISAASSAIKAKKEMKIKTWTYNGSTGLNCGQQCEKKYGHTARCRGIGTIDLDADGGVVFVGQNGKYMGEGCIEKKIDGDQLCVVTMIERGPWCPMPHMRDYADESGKAEWTFCTCEYTAQ